MLHITSVDEEELVSPLFPCRLRFAHEARDAAHGGIDLNGKQVLVETLAEDIDDTLAQTSWTEIDKFGGVAVKGEGNVGIYQHYAFESREDVVQFGGVRLEELPACGHIEEKVLDNEIAAYGTRDRLL